MAVVTGITCTGGAEVVPRRKPSNKKEGIQHVGSSGKALLISEIEQQSEMRKSLSYELFEYARK
jgi:hypothetical protein